MQATSQMNEEEIESLEKFYEKNEDFIANTENTDCDVADIINERKDEFYEEYDYLKPDCEKDFWEMAAECLTSAAEWCKEHWDEIRLIVLAVVAVIVIVALTISTFGTAALLPMIVGAAVGVGGELIGDIASFILTGKWTGTWQDYVGAALGGLTSGALFLLGGPTVSDAVGSMISTLFTESVDNITGKSDKSMSEILFDTAFSAATGVIGGKIGKKLGIGNSNKSGVFDSYGSSYKRTLTGIKNGNIENFNSKSVRNGVIDGFVKKYDLYDAGTFIQGRATEYIKGKINDGIKNQITDMIFPSEVLDKFASNICNGVLYAISPSLAIIAS